MSHNGPLSSSLSEIRPRASIVPMTTATTKDVERGMPLFVALFQVIIALGSFFGGQIVDQLGSSVLLSLATALVGCGFGVLTCFDLWMPEAARLLVRQGAQLLCCPANYGGPWTTQLARMRAMENATPLICANRTGVEMYAGVEATFRGESQIVGPMGEVWTSATEETALGLSIIDPTAHILKANPMCDDLMEEASRYALSGPHPK
jgi:hypothetical protein